MCLNKLFFKPSLPHPEEKPDPNATIENTDIEQVIDQWLVNWQVPAEYWDFWENKIVVHLYNEWSSETLSKYYGLTKDTPAFTIEENGVRHLYSLASWFNKGVVAHEQAHNSYALLNGERKLEFEEVFDTELETNKLLRYVWEHKPCMRKDVVEGHADYYRYCNAKNLEQFYIKLF